MTCIQFQKGKKEEKKRKGKGKLGQRPFARHWFQVIPRTNRLPYSKIRAPHPGRALGAGSGDGTHVVCDGSYRGWFLLGSGAWEQPQMAQAITHHPAAAQPAPIVHGYNKVLRSRLWQRHPLWALISLWVISNLTPISTICVYRCSWLYIICLIFPGILSSSH